MVAPGRVRWWMVSSNASAERIHRRRSGSASMHWRQQMVECISSYNMGYHHGLNTEYHDEDLRRLFRGWCFDARLLESDADFFSFAQGYWDGVADYKATWAEINAN